jgi:hypothetical protein
VNDRERDMSVDTRAPKAFAAISATPPVTRPASRDDDPEGVPAAAMDPAEEFAGPDTPDGGDPRALVAARLLAAVALLATAGIQLWTAVGLGLGGPLLAQSHLLVLAAVPSAAVGLLLLGRDGRLWLVAVALSLLSLVAILLSVYLPVPGAGPFPGLDEPEWLLSKAICALADLTVVLLWLIRQIAPPAAD